MENHSQFTINETATQYEPMHTQLTDEALAGFDKKRKSRKPKNIAKPWLIVEQREQMKAKGLGVMRKSTAAKLVM